MAVVRMKMSQKHYRAAAEAVRRLLPEQTRLARELDRGAIRYGHGVELTAGELHALEPRLDEFPLGLRVAFREAYDRLLTTEQSERDRPPLRRLLGLDP